MTNSLNKMAGKNHAERNGTPGRPRNTSKMRPGVLRLPNAVYINSIVTPPRRPLGNAERQLARAPPPQLQLQQQQQQMIQEDPVMVSRRTSTVQSPTTRVSPGLVAGYFAGGKWSEPPSPATLPKPPQHWTQLIFANKCVHGMSAPAADIASQLKVLLKVQA